MNMNNLCIFTGRLVADVEYKETVNGTPHVNFQLAVDGRYNKDTKKTETVFIFCDAWGVQAKHVSQRCQKGDILQICSYFRRYKKADETEGFSFTAERIQGPYAMNWHDQGTQANGFQPVGQSTEPLPSFAPSNQSFSQPTEPLPGFAPKTPPAPSFDPVVSQESQATADINDNLPFLN